MIVKRKADKEELEQVAADMCKWYCRYPLIWDEQVSFQNRSYAKVVR